ncbi:SLC13 family permease [Nitrospira sp. T9]|uniref:SLC13 family permease n=1 Tax=unclassified Nitrospira TaxID=2652172 RepID=UPI003F9C0532
MHETPIQTIFGFSPLWVATSILILTYAVIIAERFNRAIVALLGAAAVIGTGVLTQDQAIQGIDFNTIGLLTGMMILVGITKECGIFQFLAIKAAKAAKGSPWGILVMLSIVTAVLSAFLDNVTTVLLVAPVTLLIADELKINPYPLLFAEINASNTGGTATLIGDPPNIMIGSATSLTFNDFVIHLAPVAIVAFSATLIPLWFMFGKTMFASPEARARIMAFNEYEAIRDVGLLKHCLLVFSLVILGFILAHSIGMEPATIALGGAALLLLLVTFSLDNEQAGHKVHALFGQVEWITIFFFCGLFIIVTGVEHTGLLQSIADWTLSLTAGNFMVTTLAILWVSAILSAIVDNIPFVATMIPMIKSMLPVFQQAGIPLEQAETLWWALSLGSCLGGNGTLVGASANLIVAGIAERNGVPFRFLPFLKMAFPLMILQILISTLYIWMRYL